MTGLRVAWRRLRAAPGFLAASVATLALGMGANALVFSAVNGLLLRPLPFADGDRLVWLFAQNRQSAGERDTVSSEEGDALARRTSALATTAAIGDAGLVRELPSGHDRWLGIWATRSLAEVLRVHPVVGALPEELPAEGGPRAILVSYERWVRDFGSDPAIVGRRLDFADNKHFVVAGILPAGLEFPFARVPHKGNGAGFRAGVQDFWILAPDRPGSHPGGVMMGRLAAGRTVEAASAEVAAVQAALRKRGEGRALILVPLREQVLGMLARVLPLLQLFSVLVLLIACANLANLMLARAAASQTEVSVRVALGARRADLIRLRAAEASIIAGAGSLLAIALAVAGRRMLWAMAPRHSALLSRISIDMAVLAWLGGIAVAVTIAFGVAAAVRRPEDQIAGVLSSTRHTARGTRRTAGWLAVAQLALSLTLLAGAAALWTSLDRLLGVDGGYETGGVIAAETLLYIPNREATQVLGGLLARLKALPYVESAAFVHSTPLTAKWMVRDTFEVLDGPAAGVTPEMPGSFVSQEFFATLRIPVLAGREFDVNDTTRRDFPIIINDVAARRFFPHRNPVGAHVKMTNRVREIVGVVKATRDVRLDAPPEPQWYQPSMHGSSELLVRVSGPPAARLADLRQQILSADPRMMLQRMLPLDDIVADSVLERRLASRIVGAFAGVALALAAVGLFGVVHSGVVRRRREFAIRSALGATRAAIVRAVVAQSLVIAGTGAALGAALSVAGGRLLQRVLFETDATSPGVLGASAAVLIIIAVAAAVPPAWGAAAADPLASLRPD